MIALPSGNVALHGRKVGYTPYLQTIEGDRFVESSLELGEIELRPAAEVNVRVVDEDGVPIGGAEVWPIPGYSSLLSDHDGLARFSDILRGRDVQMAARHGRNRPPAQSAWLRSS